MLNKDAYIQKRKQTLLLMRNYKKKLLASIKEKQEIRAKQKEIFEKAKADIEEAKLHAAYRNIDSLK